MANLARCSVCNPGRGPVAGPSRLVSLPSLSLQSRRNISFVPRKRKHAVSYKVLQVPFGENTKGTTLSFGEMGIRMLWPARIKQATFATMHFHLQKYTKDYKNVKIYWRRFPWRGVPEKGKEVKMGKGRGSFAYLADNVAGGRVLVEMSVEGMTRTRMIRALKAVAARCPSRCEIIDRYAMPLVGVQKVSRDWKSPQSMPRGAYPAFNTVVQGTKTDSEMMQEFRAASTPEASQMPLETVQITQGRRKGEMVQRVVRTAKPSEWREKMLAIYKSTRHVRSHARQVVAGTLGRA